MTFRWIICLSFAYLVGSMPFGVIIGRLKGVDIREHGSKNIGASNVGRVLGKRFGILCFFLDALKGALPVFLAGLLNHLYADPWSLSAAQLSLWFAVAVASVLGHMFSIFLRMKGGKGVA
ncbi:MAG TPA: glycerol-3-phosphate acyltransferase, partial [Phycisphaerales bacterium]|nr:glycerol-3-phosphate acyltransferase [Phycisphaerales bacterium]